MGDFPAFTIGAARARRPDGISPGPWQVRKEPGEEWWFGGTRTKDAEQVVIQTKDGGFIAVTTDGKQNIIDAKAIAALPALIEALVEVRPQLRGLTKRGEDMDWRPAEKNLALVDAALKQAGVEL